MKKKSFIYFGAALLGLSFMTSCDDNWELPPTSIPTASEEMKAGVNTTIADFKKKYWSDDRNSATLVGKSDEASDMIIHGRVVSSDESGNIYKNLVIQDIETGDGLTISLDTTDIYKQYQIGQEIYINVTGMYGGMYNNLFQLGGLGTYNNAPSMTFADGYVFAAHAQADGLSNINAIDTTAVTLQELRNANNDMEQRRHYMSRIVRIDDVAWEGAGQLTFADGASVANNTNRFIRDTDGNRIIVRNSAHASFQATILPKGRGSVTGILSYYGTDGWQLMLNGIDGVQGFEWVDEIEDPSTVVVTSLNEGWEEGVIPATWRQVQLAGNKSWYTTTFDANTYAAMTGYKGTAPFDQWLISPAVDMDQVEKKVLSFRSQVNGYGSTTTKFNVYILNSPDPAKATVKEKLNPALPTAPSSGYSSWVESGNLDLSKFTGKVYVGFQYEATQDANYATWCVDDIVLGTPAETGGDNPGTPEIPAGLVLLQEDNTDGISDWTIENITLPAGVEKIWQWKGYNNKYYLNGSAYSSTGTADSEAWAISPVIDLTAAKTASVSFDHAAKFQTTLTKVCGFAARVEGSTTWTTLTIPTWPTAGSWTFVNSGTIDLSQFVGKKIQLGFKYGSTAEGADTWEIKNLTIVND